MASFLGFLPTRRRIVVWLRTHRVLPSKPSRFRLLVTDFQGDDDTLSRTRHLEAALLDQTELAILPVSGTPPASDRERLDRCRSLIAGHNGDSLILGDVVPTNQRIRIRMISRYEQEPGRHGPYQMGWMELPETLGPDVAGHLQTLMALSLSPAARNDRDRACLINLLRPAATRLTRLLEEPDRTFDGERQGVAWHMLGVAASLLGDFTESRRWLEVAVHACRTALLVPDGDADVSRWATVQNNLGQALRRLAEQQHDRRKRALLLEQSIDAFQEAARVHGADAASAAYLRQTATNLAHAEALVQTEPLAA
ncbi:MAG: hypothetical protein ACR2RA_16600 [Geminicoccaceae bacterium]